MTYDFDKIMAEPLAPAAPTAPAAPVQTQVVGGGYDFDKIMSVPAQDDNAKSAALFEASFGNPTEEAKKKKLSESIQRMTGAYIAPSVMDVKDAERQFRQHEADHATRASPRTSAFLSNAENAKIAMDDAKTLAQIEAASSYLWGSTKAGAHDLAGAMAKLVDAANPFTLSDSDAAVLFRDQPEKLKQYRDQSATMSLSRFAREQTAASTQNMKDVSPAAQARYGDLKYATTDAAGAAYLSPVKLVSDAVRSLPTSVALMLTTYLTRGAAVQAEKQALATGATAEAAQAAAVDAAVNMAVKFGAGSEGTIGYAQQALQTQSDIEARSFDKMDASPEFQRLVSQGYDKNAARMFLAARAGEQAGVGAGFVDAITNAIGGKFLGKIIGEGGRLLPRIAKGFGNEAGVEFVQSGGEQLFQNMATQANADPAQNLSEGVLESMLQGLFVGGLTGGAFSGVLGRAHKAEAAQSDGAQLLDLAAKVAESETRRIHPPTFDAFFQDVTEGATVFIDPDKLTEALAESKLDLATVLPTAAAAIANREYVGTGIEIPVSELISGLAGTGFEQAVIEHVRKDPDAMTIAEANKPIDDQMALYQEAVEKALKTGERSAEFNTQIQQIQDDVAAGLDAIGAYTPTANKTQAKAIGAFYAVLADKVGVTPLQLRDGWTDAEGRQHKGIRFSIGGAAVAPQTSALSQGFNHGNAMLNVGLSVGTPAPGAQTIDAALVKAELAKMGVQVLSGEEVPGQYPGEDGKMVDELTYVPHMSRPLTADEMMQLTVALKQEAIPQYHNGIGTLHGTPENLAKYGGAFNPMYFKDQKGTALSDAQAELAQQKGKKKKRAATKAVDVSSPEFKAWFWDSKVVDADGKPLRVYHATSENFDVFGKDASTLPRATRGESPYGAGWFAELTEHTNQFIDEAIYNPRLFADEANIAIQDLEWNTDIAPSIYPSYLAISRPFDVTQLGSLHEDVTPAHARSIADALDMSADEREQFMLDTDEDPDSFWAEYSYTMLSAVLEHPSVASAIARGGYDGIKATEVGSTVWLAFAPSQIKSAVSNTGAFSNEDPSILHQQGKKKKAPKAIAPGTEAALIEAASIENANKIADTGKFDYIRDLKEQIQNAVRAAAQGADLSATSDEVRKYLTDLGTQEALAAMQSNANAIGWYDIKTRQALSVVALVHPEILTDPDARFTFIYALAVTSNGQKVLKNFELAERAYAGWKESGGTMPSHVGAGGPAGKRVHEALARYNDLVKKFGSPAAVEEFMLTEFTAKELAAEGFGKAGENVDTVVLGAAILGPKIGNGFFANLNGIFHRLTMDRWLMRTWGRWTGTLLRDNQADVGAEGKVLKALVRAVRADKESNAAMRQVFAMSTKGVVDKALLTAKASPWEALVKAGDIRHIADQLQLRSAPPVARAVMSSSPLLDELRRSGNRMANKMDGSNEAPGGGNQRNWIRAVFGDILRNVVDSTGKPMEMADLQALLWYPEKRLYDSAKADAALEGYEDDEAPDYANAAAALARSKGIGEAAIASALANPADRAATVRPVASGAVARELGSFDDESGQPDGAQEELYQDSPAVRAGAVSGPVVGVHYSKEARTALSSAAFGTGMKGAEQERVAASTDPRIKQRIAFYVNTGTGIKPESGVGSHAHTATLTNLYDADADVLKLWRNNRGDLNAAESGVLDAGFDGYLKRDGLGAAVLLGRRSRAVEPVAATDVPEVPTPQIPAMKAAAIELATNTSLISGRQTAAEWKRDLTRIDPEMAAKVEWEKLDQEKLFYRQDLADTLWQGSSELFAGQQDVRRGSFSPATMDLRLLADANLSTFLHETSHWFLAAYTQVASEPGAPQALVDEVNALLAHLFTTVQGGAQPGGDLGQQVGAKPVDVLSAAFERWFGGSKVVDATGKPMRVYHTSTGAFDAFKTQRGDIGTHFGTQIQAESRFELKNESDPFASELRGVAHNTIPAYLSLQNPLRLPDLGSWQGAYAKAAIEKALGVKIPGSGSAQSLKAAIQKAGYDGVVYLNTKEAPENPADSYIAFDSAQIKSAISNTGEFSRKDGSILRQDGDVPAPTPPPPGATPLEQWNNMTLDQQRPYHEAWAESGEQYFMTGKAPSLALDSVFRTFANWLKRIYGSLKEFVAGHSGGKIDPTTAAFFDRMLATEAEIQQANEARGYVQLFKDAAEAGMTENQWAAYQAMGDDQREDAEAMLRARSLRDMKWLQNARTKIIGAMQKEAEAQRKAVREQIATELAATPLRLAVKWLKKGEMTQADGTELKATEGYKMSKDGLDEIFPEGALTPRPDLSALRGMMAKEGLHPDLVAEMFGFRSGEALVRDLLEMKPFKEEVEELTDLRMLQDHSELIDPAAIERAADEAIHNDARTRMVATELAALAKGIGSPVALMKAAKEYARQLVETKTSKTLKPWSFAAAETRAGKAALTALRKGKRDEAAQQKRLELLNHVATKQAYAAEAEVKKIIDRFKRIAGYKDSDSAFKSRDAELVNAVRAILADFGIGTKGKSAREYLAVVAQHNPDLAAVLSDTIDSVAENAKDWRELKISEVRDLAEEIEGLWFLAKRSKQIEIDGKIITLKEAQQAIYDRLDELGIPDRVPGEGSAVTAAEKRGIMFDRFVGALRRVEAWVGAKDGALTGPFRTYMWNPIRDAADAYRADKARYLKAYRDLLAPIAPSLTRRLIDAPEIGYVFGKDEGGMGKIELLHAILHTGNDSNKRKLLLGRQWATERADGALDTSKWDAFLQRMHDEGVLTKADYDFAQGVWDLLEGMKPMAQKAHRDVFGKYFAEVTANAFTNQFGTYAGGYVPAMTDPLIVRDQDLNKMREAEEGNMAYAFPTTAKGFTKSRVEYNRPLKLDLRTLSTHIDKVLLFSHMTRPTNDVRRVMSGKSVAQALGRVNPQAYNTLLLPWLNRAAKQVVETQTPGREGLGRFWSVVRARAGMAAMFANVANSVQQITGLSLAAVRVRPGLLMDAMVKFTISPRETAAYVAGKSKFMTTRLENEVSQMASQINEILVNPSVYESAKEWTNKHAYFMQYAVDSVIGPVVWLGGYNQAIEAGMSELDAVRAGDSAVRETQGSQAPEDIAAFETGSAFYRMFTQFAGYFNMNANLLGTEFVKLGRDMGLKKGAGRGLYLLTLGFLAPAIVGELIMQLFKGGPDDEDKDGEYLDDWLTAILGYGVLRYATAMVPGVGPAINATVNTLNNKQYDDRISTAPAISMVESAVKAPIDLYKAIVEDGKPSKAIKEVATLISMTVGVPGSALAKPVSYLADVAAGRVAPTSAGDAIRGTITGAASPASKQ